MLQDCEKELATGYGVEVVPGRHDLEVVPGQKLEGYPAHHYIRGPHTKHRNHSRSPRTKILGLRKTTFILTSLLVIVTIAAAIACGVGGSIAAQCTRETNNIDSAPSPQTNGTESIHTVTVTMTVPAPAPTVAAVSAAPNNGTTPTTSGLVVPTGTLALNCPNLDQAGQQTIKIGGYTWYFNSMCGTDFAGHDIVGIISYSLQNCLQACVMYNLFYGDNNCVAVHFTADMVGALAANFANCWLKNGTETNMSQRQGNLVITAVLANSSLSL
ncbi:hypothetical protein BR93DRAFT_966388 [Coniochaeta sp. PMI_546]|nr:hypothetical protein BR93DRAFT_966388 [Coniochaeta sp. PMI_546]